MKVLIAPGPYKECLDSEEVTNALAEGINSVLPNLDVVKFPICDGGTGFTKILVGYTGGKLVNTKVLGPLGYEIEAHFGILGDNKTAVIESASACGLSLVPLSQRNPLITTTYGIGQLINESMKYGCKKILIGCGDSSTNDGGAGAIQALGTRLLDDKNMDISFGGVQLLRINDIDNSQLQGIRNNLELIVACNLTSILCGPESTSRVYSPQKGANPKEVEILDNAIEHFVDIIYQKFDEHIGFLPGGGGSGGLAGGLYSLAGARLRYSMEIVSEITEFQKKIDEVDIIITGEGKIDNRTATGKIACGVALYGKKRNIPTIAVVGQIDRSVEDVYYNGIDYIESIITRPISLEESIKNAKQLISETGYRIARLINLSNYKRKNIREDKNEEEIDTLLFDLGNTLMHIPDEYNLESNFVKYFNFSSQDEVRRMIYPICTTSHKGLTFEGFVIKLTERLREYYENINPDLVRKICLDKGNNPIIEKNALEVLKYFKDKGYSLALVSNTTPISELIIRNLGLKNFFDTIVLSCDVGYLKPDPRIFQIAISNLGRKPSQVCVIGDKIRTDILGAKILGTKTVLLERNAKKVIENDHRIPTDAIIPSLEDLVSLSIFN